MSVQQAFRLRNPALLIALAAVYPVLAYSAGAGSIDFSAGNVTAVNVNGIQRPLTKGAEISNGDTIHTGDGGRAQVRFSDGAMVSLQPQTEFRIDNYQYGGKADGQEKGFFSLLKGGMRTITGLIGRSNRDNYKVTTNVATIGIRGTEYTGALNPATGELVVNTGEGLVEVCNAAGCMLLASGESGIVSAGNSTPRRTDSRPQLSPAQPTGTALGVYSSSENRNASGSILPVSAPLVSGSANYVAFAGTASTFSDIGYVTTGSVAAFDSASVLTSFQNGSDINSAGTIAGGFSMDGVIGWGRWSTGARGNTGYAGTTPLVDFHYVAGTPTPSAEISGLNVINATYRLAGFTLPTSSTGIVGSAPSGTMNASFAGGTATLSLSVNVPIGGTVLDFSSLGIFSNTGAGAATISGSSGGTTVKGFFAGSNASFAGLVYELSGGGALGSVNGALVFKK